MKTEQRQRFLTSILTITIFFALYPLAMFAAEFLFGRSPRRGSHLWGVQRCWLKVDAETCALIADGGAAAVVPAIAACSAKNWPVRAACAVAISYVKSQCDKI